MTLDCTNLKPGDRVRLRNGDISTVKKNDGSDLPIRLDNDEWNYPDGSFYDDNREDDRDIVEILPPEPPTDCTSQQQAMAVAEQLADRARNQAGASVGSSVTPKSSLLEATHDFIGCKYPDAINCNGKRYVPADSPSLYTGLPFSLVVGTDDKVAAIRFGFDDKLFTPADSWPDPITDRPPTKEDADPDGKVQRLDGDGDWMRSPWDCSGFCEYGWARTSDWKPKSTPAYTREEALEGIRECWINEEPPTPDLLASIIAHLEASDE